MISPEHSEGKAHGKKGSEREGKKSDEISHVEQRTNEAIKDDNINIKAYK